MVASDTAVLPPLRDSLVGSSTGRTHNVAESALKPSGPKHKANTYFLPFGVDGFTFLDLLDIVNPLQHLPVIGTLYRKITDDTLDPLPRVIGSTLFFGPLGGALSGANMVLAQTSGRNLDEHILALIDVGDSIPNKNNPFPKETAQAPSKNKGLSNTNPVTSWARAELYYRQRLFQASEIINNKVVPPAQVDRSPISSGTSRQAAPLKNSLPFFTDKKEPLILVTKYGPPLTKKDKDNKPKPHHLALAATAYKAAIKKLE